MINFKYVTAMFLLCMGFGITGCATGGQPQSINLHQPDWAAEHYADGMVAWNKGKTDKAARLFKDAYTFSSAEAQAMLGLLYMKGAGVFQSAEVARAYAIAADQRKDFDAYSFYHQRWENSGDADNAYLIAWILANRFSGHARQDYEKWIGLAADGGHLQARRDAAEYIN